TIASAFAVNGLRGCDDDLFDRQILLANDLEHLRGAETVNPNVFCDFRHVAAVRRLVEHYVDVTQGGADRFAVGHVALDELDLVRDPGWFAFAMGLRLEVIQDAHCPPFASQEIGQVRTNQSGTARDQGSFRVGLHRTDSLGQIRVRPSRSSNVERNPRVAGASKPPALLPFAPNNSAQSWARVTRSSTSY